MEKHTVFKEEEQSFAGSMGLGAQGDDVRLLQEELIKLGFLRIEPNGYFGESTEHAVFKFQQATGIVSDKDQLGAGYVGPATRGMLNRLLGERFDMKSLLAYQREAVDEGTHIVSTPAETIAATE